MDSHVRLTVQVAPGLASLRLDVFLVQQLPGMSRRRVRELIASGAVRLNGRVARKGHSLGAGDVVSLPAGAVAADAVMPEPMLSVRILYEDACVVAVDKPAGMPSVARRAHDRGTVANFLVGYDPRCARVSPSPGEAGLVHRLDTDTSGVLLAARTEAAYRALRRQFRRHTVEKDYVAVVAGAVRDPGSVNLAIAHAPRRRRRMCVCSSPAHAQALRARPAVTRFRPLQVGRTATMLSVRTTTGVRHQIRVHLAAIGHPIIGDRLYAIGNAVAGTRLLLHAHRVQAHHPDAGRIEVVAHVPSDFRHALQELGLQAVDPDEIPER